MKKITEKMMEAINHKRNWKLSNTQVEVFENGNMAIYLHGNLIAEINRIKDGYHIVLDNCDWQTNVTKERMNGILDVFGIHAWIVQRNYEWFLYNNIDMVKFGKRMHFASFNDEWYRLNWNTGAFENV